MEDHYPARRGDRGKHFQVAISLSMRVTDVHHGGHSHAVRAREDGVMLAQVAMDLRLYEVTFSSWMRRADIEDGERPRIIRAKSAENRVLKKRIRFLE